MHQLGEIQLESQRLDRQLKQAEIELEDNTKQQEELIRTKAQLSTELGNVKSGHQQLTTQLAKAEKTLQAVSFEREQLTNRVNELATQESAHRNAIARLERSTKDISRSHAEMLANVRSRNIRQQKALGILLVLVAGVALELAVRPWSLPDPYRWLTLTFILLPLLLMQGIALLGRHLNLLGKTLLISAALAAICAGILMPMGVDLPNVVAYVSAAAQVVGSAFAILTYYRDRSPTSFSRVASPDETSGTLNVLSTPETTFDHNADNNQSSLWTQLGDEAMTAGNLEAAIQSYQRANALEKLADAEEKKRQRLLAQLKRDAEFYIKQQNWDEAATLFRQLIDLDPTNIRWPEALQQCETETWLAEEYAKVQAMLAAEKWRSARRKIRNISERRANYRDITLLLSQMSRQEKAPEYRRKYIRQALRRISIVMAIGTTLGLLIYGSILVGVRIKTNLAVAAIAARSIPTPNEETAQTKNSFANRLFEEDFSTNRNSWQIGEEISGEDQRTIEIVDDVLRVQMTTTRGVYWPIIIPFTAGKDFLLRFDATVMDSAVDAGVGLAVRADTAMSTYYSLAFLHDGRFGVNKLESIGEWKPIVPFTEVDAFDLENEHKNTFVILSRRSIITAFANGTKVGTFDDQSVTGNGVIALAVDSPIAGNAVVEFDNIIIEKSP